jgi:hypothetical protein
MIRRGFWICASLAVVLVASLTSAGATDGPAPNSGTVVSGMTNAYAIAVGPDHIYVTPGPSGSTIGVMNPDGSQAGTIDNVSGASGAVIIHGILYVAAFGGGRIARFDLSTDPATRLKGLPTGALNEPRDLLFAGGDLWFTSGCDQWGARVGWMPLGGSWIKELTGPQAGWDYCTGLDGNRFAPNRIFLHSEGVSSEHLYEYAVGTTTPHLVATDPWEWGSYDGQPVAPLPGGDRFVMSWPTNNYPSTFSMKDMTGPNKTYQGVGGTFAVTKANGGFVAGLTGGSYTVGEVKLWPFGHAYPSVQFDFRDDHTEPYGPLAFSADGTALFTVTGVYDDVVVFRVLDPSLLPSQVQLQISDDTIKAGTITDLSVHLEAGGTNRDVTLMAFPWQTSGWQAVATQTVDADGNTVFHVSPTRHTDYEVEYAGDATTVDSGSASRTVFVEAAITGQMQGAFEVKNDVPRYHDADPVMFAMHIEPTDIQQYFHVSVEQRVSPGTWSFVTGTDVPTDPSGDGTASFAPDVLGLGRYRVHATSYGSILVGNGRSHWSRFVIVG